MSAVLCTPDLARAVADYTGVFRFECRQYIPGVLALLAHGPLQLQLWACGAPPGRWERPDPSARTFAPGHHSVVVAHIHALHASLRRVLPAAHAHRMTAEGPVLQPWGAWEFAFSDGDGHHIHCVDWGVWRPDPALLQRYDSSGDAEDLP
jgi:hypothetical protein